MINEKLRARVTRFASRLREMDDPEAQALAGELESKVRGRGRKEDPPEERVTRWMERATLSESLYHGRVVVPEEYRDIVDGAKGEWGQADEVAAILMKVFEGVDVSASSIQQARLGVGKPRNVEELNLWLCLEADKPSDDLTHN